MANQRVQDSRPNGANSLPKGQDESRLAGSFGWCQLPGPIAMVAKSGGWWWVVSISQADFNPSLRQFSSVDLQRHCAGRPPLQSVAAVHSLNYWGLPERIESK